MLIDEKVLKILADNFTVNIEDGVGKYENLVEEGYIDSFSLMELAQVIRKEFTIEISMVDIMAGKLSTYSSIVQFIESKIPKTT